MLRVLELVCAHGLGLGVARHIRLSANGGHLSLGRHAAGAGGDQAGQAGTLGVERDEMEI